MTERFLEDWLGDRAYYRIQLDQSTTDNPDQRIADDLDRYHLAQPSTCRSA